MRQTHARLAQLVEQSVYTGKVGGSSPSPRTNFMQYLYHFVPKDMQGGILYPLNELKQKYPELYKKQVKKYEGREFVMDQIIPVLDCKWNDVLHLSAIHPQEVKNALIEAGRSDQFSLMCYQIDPNILDAKETIVYKNLYENQEKKEGSNFEEYKPDEIEKYSTLPQATKKYYRKMYESGERPLVFAWAPHILYKGSIDISGLPIITV